MRWPRGSGAELQSYSSKAIAMTTTTGSLTSSRSLSYIALFAALMAVFGLIPKIDLPFGVPTERIALGLGLMLRFAENFYVQWQRLDDAYRARSGHGGGLRLLAPLTIRTLQTAERVADALAARLGR